MDNTQVRERMEPNVETATPDHTIMEVARMMRDGDFGALPICDDSGVIGLVTDRDIVVRGVAEGMDATGALVREVMTSDVITCAATDDLSDVSRLMAERQVRRVVVIDDDLRPIGMISLGDLAQGEDAEPNAAQALSEISQPTHREPLQTTAPH